MSRKIFIFSLILAAAGTWGCSQKVRDTAAGVEETMTFVDAHGEEHKMKIDPDVEKNPYDPDAFQLDGVQMAYEGEDISDYRLGVDVSFYQGKIDWEKVKAAGYDFAIIRLGYRGYGEEGNIHLDEMYKTNIENASAAGLDVGVYFFAQAVNKEEAREEAEFVIDHLEGYELDMPVVYDPESITGDESRTQDVSGKQFTKDARAFCEEIEKAGYESMIYSNMLWEAYEFDLAKLADYPIWYADYEAKPQTPYNFRIWQYTESGQVDGIQGNVDLNIELIK